MLEEAKSTPRGTAKSDKIAPSNLKGVEYAHDLQSSDSVGELACVLMKKTYRIRMGKSTDRVPRSVHGAISSAVSRST